MSDHVTSFCHVRVAPLRQWMVPHEKRKKSVIFKIRVDVCHRSDNLLDDRERRAVTLSFYRFTKVWDPSDVIVWTTQTGSASTHGHIPSPPSVSPEIDFVG